MNLHDAALAAIKLNGTPPRRRWSDGPLYPSSAATEEVWSLATQWPALSGALCEELARGSGEVARELDRLYAQGRVNRSEAAGIRRSLAAMRASGVAMQQIVRMGS